MSNIVRVSEYEAEEFTVGDDSYWLEPSYRGFHDGTTVFEHEVYRLDGTYYVRSTDDDCEVLFSIPNLDVSLARLCVSIYRNALAIGNDQGRAQVQGEIRKALGL